LRKQRKNKEKEESALGRRTEEITIAAVEQTSLMARPVIINGRT